MTTGFSFRACIAASGLVALRPSVPGGFYLNIVTIELFSPFV